MNKEAAVAAHLRRMHSPVAVVLHGSRAIGKQRPNSDWDVLLLFRHAHEPAVEREEILGEDVEWQALTIPVPEAAFLKVCGVQLQFAKVLWEDESGAGTSLLAQAASVYAKGIELTEANKRRYRQYLSHKANGMEDDADTPYLFLRHQYAFIERASNWWFEMRGEYRKPLYMAMPAIQERDPEYHDLLLQVIGPGPSREKIAAARRLISRLFT